MHSKNKESRLSLLILTGILGLLHLITVLADSSIVWQLRDGASGVLLVAVSFLWFSEIEKSKVRTRCLAFSVFCYFSIDLFILAFSYAGITKLYNYWSILEVLIFSIGYLFIWIKSFDVNTIKLTDQKVFLLRKKPKSIQDLVIAIFSASGLYAGYSFYYKGNLYSYKRGIFVLSRVNESFVEENYHICQSKDLFPVIERIEYMLGTKWTVFRNCIVLRNVWDA